MPKRFFHQNATKRQLERIHDDRFVTWRKGADANDIGWTIGEEFVMVFKSFKTRKFRLEIAAHTSLQIGGSHKIKTTRLRQGT